HILAHSEVPHDVDGGSPLLPPALAVTEDNTAIRRRHEQIIGEAAHASREVVTFRNECFFDCGVAHQYDHGRWSPDGEYIPVLGLSFLEIVMNTMGIELMKVANERKRSGTFWIPCDIFIIFVDVDSDKEK
ncbi:hypothetical protein PENTCL1PPCAC_14377, partial [Pristionchus entomophagus]